MTARLHRTGIRPTAVRGILAAWQASGYSGGTKLNVNAQDKKVLISSMLMPVCRAKLMA